MGSGGNATGNSEEAGIRTKTRGFVKRDAASFDRGEYVDYIVGLRECYHKFAFHVWLVIFLHHLVDLIQFETLTFSAVVV
jgi:hypothetical protein